MRIKRKTLLERVEARLESNKKNFDGLAKVKAAKRIQETNDWVALYSDEWSAFLTKARKFISADKPITSDMLPQKRGSDNGYYRSSSVAVLEPNDDERVYEADADLTLLRDLLISAVDDVVETRELGLKSLVKDLCR